MDEREGKRDLRAVQILSQRWDVPVDELLAMPASKAEREIELGLALEEFKARLAKPLRMLVEWLSRRAFINWLGRRLP